MRLLRFLVAGAVALVVVYVSPVQTTVSAEYFSCHFEGCPNEGGCEGDLYKRNRCAITCYNDLGGGELEEAGGWNCNYPGPSTVQR